MLKRGAIEGGVKEHLFIAANAVRERDQWVEDSVCVGMQGRVSDEPAGDLRHGGAPGHFSKYGFSCQF